ncbi:MAG: alpha/beta fold hydrolase [Cyanobacteria bacterium NC_groundwater_1444_Ag_S-0.65um_54_12]|nr:alpha/beta fold hydrolase [Cyanobacteria bacterium NC_groundwater_1444_Ag_S-0.65um_54_12]
MTLGALRAARMLLGTFGSRLFANGRSPIRKSTHTACQVTFDWYEASSTVQRILILVHGVTLLGKSDERLQHFARALAASGLRVAAIDLPGLKTCNFVTEDSEAIATLTVELASKYQAPVGLVGFSFGAGLALTAACRAEVHGSLDQVLCFGAYHSLSAIWEHCLELYRQEPQTYSEWNDFIYMMLVMALSAKERLNLNQTEQRTIVSTLEAYCKEPSLASKRGAYEQLRHLPIVAAFSETMDHERNCQLSPAGKLAALTARVNLLHDNRDRVIPPQESLRIFEELRAGGRARLLVTPLLSHIYLGSLRGVLDIPTLLSMLGETIG